MEIKLLTPGYKKDEKFYQAFQEGKLWESEYISDQSVWIPNEVPDFPIYFPLKMGENHNTEFLLAIEVIDKNILNLDRDYYMDELFWHSILCLYKREYLISLYPSIINNYKEFSNIVIKPFDWQNYIYKAILISQYVADERPFEKKKYYKIIFENMDMFNYIIKYEIFRNGPFLLNVMDIITDNHLENQLKAKIKNRPDLGADERYGRRVILELNRSYPVIMSPMLSKKELEKYFMRFLSYYIEKEAVVTDRGVNTAVEKVEDVLKKEKNVRLKDEADGTSMLLLYEQWLRENNFVEKVIEQYTEKLEEVRVWYKQDYSKEFYTIRDIKEICEIQEKLRKRTRSVKHKQAMKYYVQFFEQMQATLLESEMMTSNIIS